MAKLGENNLELVDPTTDRFQIWALKDIYLGVNSTGRYIPNKGDWVYNDETGERWRVQYIDQTTFIAKLSDIVETAVDPVSGADALLLGQHPLSEFDTHRVYVDKSVKPHTLTVDQRMFVGGSMTSYAKIFSGDIFGGNAVEVGAFYDTLGNVISTNIPLELAETYNDRTVHHIKSVMPCKAIKDLNSGEYVTVVFYNDDGGVVRIRRALVVETTLVRKLSADRRIIESIHLESPLLSEADPKLLQYPMHLTVDGFNLFGVVTYTDGSTLRMPVDGTKFKLMGLDGFEATYVSQKAPLVLKYNMSSDEMAMDAKGNADRFKTESYSLVVVKADGKYNVRLYAYPKWIDSVNGYRLEWYLFNLDRGSYAKVTPWVTINENTATFDPTLYNVNQKLSVSIDLNKVNGSFKNYVHNQIIDISLLRQGIDHSGTMWTVGFEPNQSPLFGRENAVSMRFINQNLKYLDLTLGETSFDKWIQRAYYQTRPLYNTETEIEPVKPNMFQILTGGKTYDFRIDQWNSELEINSLMSDSDTLFVVFIKRTADEDLYLSIAGFPIFQKT